MEFEGCNRDGELQELKDFAKNTERQLNEILMCLGWSEHCVQRVQPPIVCPFNSSHSISAKRLEQHLERCLWKAEGYGDLDTPLSIPSVPPDAHFCIKFDEQLQEDILERAQIQCPAMKKGAGIRLIPRTSARLIMDFTPEERKTLYEYVVANTIQPDIGGDITDLNKSQKYEHNKTSSYLELAAQERNLKRRRAKHRGVHTNKKSHTEIFREIISQQMEMLTEYISEQIDDRTPQNKITENKSSDYSRHIHDELKSKDGTTHERKLSSEISVRSTRNNRDRDRRNTSQNHHDYEAYERTRHSKKSTKNHDSKCRQDLEERKHHKSRRRHRSKDGYHDKYKRDRSHERDSPEHSRNKKHETNKKSQYNDRN